MNLFIQLHEMPRLVPFHLKLHLAKITSLFMYNAHGYLDTNLYSTERSQILQLNKVKLVLVNFSYKVIQNGHVSCYLKS